MINTIKTLEIKTLTVFNSFFAKNNILCFFLFFLFFFLISTVIFYYTAEIVMPTGKLTYKRNTKIGTHQLTAEMKIKKCCI